MAVRGCLPLGAGNIFIAGMSMARIGLALWRKASPPPWAGPGALPSVAQVSKSARRGLSRRPQVWKPATQQTWKSALRWRGALHGRTISTTPTPILRSRAETRCHWIIPNVPRNPRLITPNPVIVRLRLPEWFFTHAHDLLGPTRTELFPRFQKVAQQVVRRRPDDGMNVIGHHHPLVEQIPALVKMPHRVRHETGDVRSPQMARASTTVQIPFYAAAKITRDILFGIGDGLSSSGKVIQSAQPFGLFALKFQQHLLGQGVGQTKRDEVRSPFALHVREVTSV